MALDSAYRAPRPLAVRLANGNVRVTCRQHDRATEARVYVLAAQGDAAIRVYDTLCACVPVPSLGGVALPHWGHVFGMLGYQTQEMHDVYHWAAIHATHFA